MTSSNHPRRIGPADDFDDDYTGARYEDEAMALANKGRGRQPPRPGGSRSYTRKTPAGSQAQPRGQTRSERLQADVMAAYGRQFLLAPTDGGPHLPAMAVGRRLDCVVALRPSRAWRRVATRCAAATPSARRSLLPMPIRRPC